MVNFYIEMEGGRMKEKNFSDYPADFNPCHELFHAIQDILFYLLVYENVQLNQFFFDTCDKYCFDVKGSFNLIFELSCPFF